MDLMGQEINYPEEMRTTGLSGYKWYYSTTWKKFDFPNYQDISRISFINIIKKGKLIESPKDIVIASETLTKLAKKTNNPIVLIQEQENYLWGIYYDPKIQVLKEYWNKKFEGTASEDKDSIYARTSNAVKFAIGRGRTSNPIYIQTPRIYDGIFDKKSYQKEPYSHETYYWKDILISTLINPEIQSGFQHSRSYRPLRIYVFESSISPINWNSVPWDNNFK
tara:strand:- start:247 stop:912 length:666 start_codon:yes stop_codon:yes gene_type:complete